MKIGVLIPTRDRPEFLSHAIYLLENQSLTPDVVEIVDDKTDFDFPDVTWRYRTGFERIKNKCDLVFCWEDDDWYHWDYLNTMYRMWLAYGKPSMMGLDTTIYYHIVKRMYVKLVHGGRSSMMSMTISSDCAVPFCDDSYQYLDYHLWRTYKGSKKAIHIPRIINVGIKHGLGKFAGGGHNKYAIYDKLDYGATFLKSIIADRESFERYAKLFEGC